MVAGHSSFEKDEAGNFVATPQDYGNYISMLKILKEEFQAENPTNPLLLTAATGGGRTHRGDGIQHPCHV